MQFSMSVICEACHGKGTTEITVYAQKIMLMVLHNVEDGKVQKIPAIKQLRNEYGMGLKAAKELIEGAMEFYSTIQKNASQIPIHLINPILNLHEKNMKRIGE
jgi:ribosomal protein L7/L12